MTLDSVRSKILIIEDDDDTREFLVEMLTGEGYDVVGAANGPDGLASAQQHKPDGIVCDIVMPDMHGYQVLTELRQRQEFSQTSFIFLSARADPSEIREGLDLGADDYVTKPFVSDHLLTSLAVNLAKREKVRTLQSPQVRHWKHHAFISYSRTDEREMRAIVNLLNQYRVSTWVDADIPLGHPSWRRKIQDAMDAAGCVIVLFSPEAKRSEWVEEELSYAQAQHKPVFPIIVRGNISNAVLLGYTKVHMIDVQGKVLDEEIAKLSRAIYSELKLALR